MSPEIPLSIGSSTVCSCAWPKAALPAKRLIEGDVEMARFVRASDRRQPWHSRSLVVDDDAAVKHPSRGSTDLGPIINAIDRLGLLHRDMRRNVETGTEGKMRSGGGKADLGF